MLLKSPTNTKLDRNRRILSMLDPRTDPTTRIAALDQVDKMLKEAQLEWGDLAPLITPKARLKKVYPGRSEEHTSELQSLMRISYAVFCLKKNTIQRRSETTISPTNHIL